jgi:hypothetical protein
MGSIILEVPNWDKPFELISHVFLDIFLMYVRNSIKICNQDFRCLALRKEVRGILIL